MMMSPNHKREVSVAEQLKREAELVEQVARSISLCSDRDALLAKALSLRRRADELEAQSGLPPDLADRPAPT